MIFRVLLTRRRIDLIFSLLSIQRTTTTTRIITNTVITTGITNAKIDKTIEPINSPVATTKLPRPPVVAVETPRAATVLICTAPAVPPPIIIAAAQVANCDISPLLTAIVLSVPATTAAGVAIVSKRLSIHGT